MKTVNTDVLVIGGGPAGIQASRLLKINKPELSVTVLRPEDYSVVYCAIPYAIEGTIDMSRIAKSDELVTGVGAELKRNKAVEVSLKEKYVITDADERIEFDQLLIVTGARPFIPPIEGHELKGIYTVKMGEDAQMINEVAKKSKKAVVIGAGAIGLEQAQAFRHLGLHVDLVEMEGHPLASMVDSELGGEVASHLKDQGINLHLGRKVEKFAGKERVEKVVLDDGQELDLEDGFVVACTGVKPNVELFIDKGLEIAADGIVVDAGMRTNMEGIFAAGDVVSFHSIIDGKQIGGKLATNAVPMAKIAAKSMLGEEAEYRGFLNGAVTCSGEWRVGGTGYTEDTAGNRGYKTVGGFGETTSRFPMMPGASKVMVKLVADAETGIIIGGQAYGKEAIAERIDTITMAISCGMTAKQLAQFSYSAQPWQTFFPAKNAIVMAAEEIVKKLKNS